MAETISQLPYPTLMSLMAEYSSTDTTGMYLKAAEVLNRRIPFMRVLPIITSNQLFSHLGAKDSVLGSIQARRFNEGVTPTTTKQAVFTDPIANFLDYSEVDADLYKSQPDPATWRWNQDRRKLEGARQGIETLFFYGDISTNPLGINGLFKRYNSLSFRPNGDASQPYNVVGASGTSSDLTSVAFIEFGENKVYGFVPPNGTSINGLSIRDLGEQTKVDANGKMLQVYRTMLAFYVGLGVADDRCVQRICNIKSTGTSNIITDDLLIDSKNQLPEMGEAPGTFLFVPRKIKSQMEKIASDKTNANFTQERNGDGLFGTTMTYFMGIPILVADMISTSETQVS